MGSHDQLRICLDGGFEGREFNSVESIQLMRNSWKSMMEIAGCISMTRKMFGCGSHSLRLYPFDQSRSQFPDQFWVLAKRTDTHHRIFGVDVDIGTWRVIHINAMRGEFPTWSVCPPRCQSKNLTMRSMYKKLSSKFDGWANVLLFQNA